LAYVSGVSGGYLACSGFVPKKPMKKAYEQSPAAMKKL